MPKDDAKSDEDYTRRVMKARTLEDVNNMQRGQIRGHTQKEGKEEE
jgi:hypothetical protein